jgi:hypothetical protein
LAALEVGDDPRQGMETTVEARMDMNMPTSNPESACSTSLCVIAAGTPASSAAVGKPGGSDGVVTAVMLRPL